MTRRFTGDQILVATHNAGKLQEMTELFAPFRVTVKGAAEMNLGEPEETENTFIGNARIKARAAVAATGLPALADDSGIEVEALDNRPRRLYRRLVRNAQRPRFRHGNDQDP